MGHFQIDELNGVALESVVRWAVENRRRVADRTEAECLFFFSGYDWVWAVWCEGEKPRVALIKKADGEDRDLRMNAVPCRDEVLARRFAARLKYFERLLAWIRR